MQISWIGGDSRCSAINPAFLTSATAVGTFWATIPYRIYPLLALVMVFLVSLTGRDFGPMRRAERKAAEAIDPPTPATAVDVPVAMHWTLGAMPAVVLVLMTLGLMAWTGWHHAANKGMTLPFQSRADVISTISTILGESDSNNALLYASLTAAVLAIVLAVARGR